MSDTMRNGMRDADSPVPPASGAPAEATPSLPPLDEATWMALADYVSGHASADLLATIETRAAADPAYADLVASVCAVWALPFPELIDWSTEDALDALDAADTVDPLASEAEAPPALSPPVSPPVSPRDIAAAWDALAATLDPVSPMPPLPPPSTPPHATRPLRQTPSSVIGWLRPAWHRHPVLWSSLAVLALTLGGVQLDRHYLHPLYYYHATTTAHTVTLPDHSTAVLAPGAYLGTDRSFIHGARTVYLFGRAHFIVAPDPARPFSVRVLEAQATALGTTFTVASDTTTQVTVDVQTGKVSLTRMGADGALHPVAVLTAGQVQNIPALTRWFTKLGSMLAAAGVPLREAMQIQAALLRAAAATVPATPATR